MTIRASASLTICVLGMLAAGTQAFAGALVLQDWGVYTARVIGRTADPDSTAGKFESSTDEELLLQTTEICASVGTWFGIRFRLSGDNPVPLLKVMTEIDHPALPTYHGGKQWVDMLPSSVSAGQRQLSLWIFHDTQRLVAGDWTFTVRSLGGQNAVKQDVPLEDRMRDAGGVISSNVENACPTARERAR